MLQLAGERVSHVRLTLNAWRFGARVSTGRAMRGVVACSRMRRADPGTRGAPTLAARATAMTTMQAAQTPSGCSAQLSHTGGVWCRSWTADSAATPCAGAALVVPANGEWLAARHMSARANTPATSATKRALLAGRRVSTSCLVVIAHHRKHDPAEHKETKYPNAPSNSVGRFPECERPR